MDRSLFDLAGLVDDLESLLGCPVSLVLQSSLRDNAFVGRETGHGPLMKGPGRDRAVLEDMRRHDTNATAHARSGRDALAYEPILHAVFWALAILGEAANRVSEPRRGLRGRPGRRGVVDAAAPVERRTTFGWRY